MSKIFQEKCPICGIKIIGRSEKQASYCLKTHIKACKRKRAKIEKIINGKKKAKKSRS